VATPEQHQRYNEASGLDRIRLLRRRSYWLHRDRLLEERRQWRAEHPAKVAEYAQRRREKSREGGYDLYRHRLSADSRVQLQARQGHACALCQRPFAETKRVAVDHDHATGRVRGLLCPRCNAALGWYETKRAAVDAYIAAPQTILRTLPRPTNIPAQEIPPPPLGSGYQNRVKTHCPQGHAYADNSYISKQGGRTCKTCARAAADERFHRLHPTAPYRK